MSASATITNIDQSARNTPWRKPKGTREVRKKGQGKNESRIQLVADRALAEVARSNNGMEFESRAAFEQWIVDGVINATVPKKVFGYSTLADKVMKRNEDPISLAELVSRKLLCDRHIRMRPINDAGDVVVLVSAAGRKHLVQRAVDAHPTSSSIRTPKTKERVA